MRSQRQGAISSRNADRGIATAVRRGAADGDIGKDAHATLLRGGASSRMPAHYNNAGCESGDKSGRLVQNRARDHDDTPFGRLRIRMSAPHDLTLDTKAVNASLDGTYAQSSRRPSLRDEGDCNDSIRDALSDETLWAAKKNAAPGPGAASFREGPVYRCAMRTRSCFKR